MLLFLKDCEITRLVRVISRGSGEVCALTVELAMRRFKELPGMNAQPPRRRYRNPVRRPIIAAEEMINALPVRVARHRGLEVELETADAPEQTAE